MNPDRVVAVAVCAASIGAAIVGGLSAWVFAQLRESIRETRESVLDAVQALDLRLQRIENPLIIKGLKSSKL